MLDQKPLVRIIDYLRVKHPYLNWEYHHQDIYQWKGFHKTTGDLVKEVGKLSKLDPQYDEDDDTSRSIYLYSDTQNSIWD